VNGELDPLENLNLTDKENVVILHPFHRSAVLAAAVFVLAGFTARVSAGESPTVIALTQTGCQFLESENGIDHGYKTTRKEDCEVINRASAEQRLADAKTLSLKPGKYIFRVTNKDVPYMLGFYLRGAGVIDYATLPRVSGGGLTTGKTQDYAIELKPGSYVYSCPLNPTPDYKIEVSAG
jgi:hypothetical protein